MVPQCVLGGILRVHDWVQIGCLIIEKFLSPSSKVDILVGT